MTKDEVISKINAVYEAYIKTTGYYDSPDVEVKSISDDLICVGLSQMYQAPAFNSTVVFALCEAFGTKHINETDQWSHGGCETCDYGSSYGFELEIQLPKVEVPK